VKQEIDNSDLLCNVFEKDINMAIKHRRQNPSPEIEYSVLAIPDENDFGTGRFTMLVKANELSSAKAITCIVVISPAFQISVNINPWTLEITVILARADGIDPISEDFLLSHLLCFLRLPMKL